MSTSVPVTTFETGHIGLTVSDVTRSSQFYQQVFGFDVVLKTDADHPYAFLKNDGKVVLTLWQHSAGRYSHAHPGLHHLSFQVKSLEDVKLVLRNLRALNVRLLYDDIVAHAEGASSGGVFFEDPDGIRLEIFSPTGLEGYHAEGVSCSLLESNPS